MVNQGLTEYVRNQLRRGYSPDAVRTALISAGYSPQDISIALRASGAKRIDLSGKKLLVVAGSVIALVLLIVSAFLVFRAEAKEIVLAMRLEKSQLLPGEVLGVAVTLSSEQRSVVPVSLEFVVLDASNKAVTSRTQRLDVGKEAFITLQMPLPPKIPQGEYELRLTIRFSGFTRVQSARFNVIQPAVIPSAPVEELPEELVPLESECPPSCDDLNPATEDFCEEGQCVHKIIPNLCGNGECEPGENEINCRPDCGTVSDKEAVVQQAVSLAGQDAERAAVLCTSLVLAKDTDQCFFAIANASKKSSLCANIQSLNTRDDCYIDFVFAGDYSVCEQLNNRFYLTTCLSFKSNAIAQQEFQQPAQEPEEIA